MKKKIIAGLIILVAAGGLFIFRDGDSEHEFATVEERDLVEEVFETGVVKSGDSINLSFRSGGELTSLNVSEGQIVERSQFVAGLDTTDLEIQKRQAESRIDAQTAELEMLNQGARDEDIRDLENRLKDAEESVSIAERSLKEARESRESALENSYIGTSSLVNRAYLLSKSLKEDYNDLKDRYFVGFYLQETYRARRSIRDIEDAYDDLRVISRSINENSSFEEKEEGLNQAEETFLIIEDSIEALIDISEIDFYERRFSTASTGMLWEGRDEASEMISSIASKKGGIISTKNETRSGVTSAESNLTSARAQRNELRDRLEAAKRGGREEEIKALEANLRSAGYDLRLTEREIEKSRIYSPQRGKVSKVHLRENEQASPGAPVVTILTDEEFYIETDIYEGDITSVNAGDPVSIELVAYPGEIFNGEVTSIDQTGQLIDGVVYYKTDISIENSPERIMPEMSADATIETSKKTTISLPREAIGRDGARRYVEILEDSERKEVEIETGITDAYGYVEIISGLSAGDQVLID